VAKAGLASRLFWLLSLAGMLTPASLALYAPDEVAWSPVNIPGEGPSGGWVLARGSDVRHLAIAGDDTLYAYATPSGTSDTLFKSTDDGQSWLATGNATDEIVAITPTPMTTIPSTTPLRPASINPVTEA
jgi:hypothetical protein